MPRLSPPADAGNPRSRLARWSLPIGGAISVGALAFVLTSSGGVADVIDALGQVSWPWALAAVGAEVVYYLLLAVQLRQLSGHPPLALRHGIRVSLLAYGLGNVLPGAPAPGMLLAASELRRVGRDATRTRLALTFTLWFSTRTLVGIAAFAFLVAIVREQPTLRGSAEWGIAAVAVIAALALTARMASREQTAEWAGGLLARARFRRPRAPVEETRAGARAWYAQAREVIGTPRRRAGLVAVSAASWLADATCLALALKAAGVAVDPDVLLIVYVGAMAITALPLLPGGIGAVEAAIPVLLHAFGAPLDAALAGTLVYRGIAFLAPAAIGALVLAHSEVRSRRLTRRTSPPDAQVAEEALAQRHTERR